MTVDSTILTIAGCPGCGATAEVISEGFVAGTDGPTELVRVRCVDRHWFLMPADRLVVPGEPIAASRLLGRPLR